MQDKAVANRDAVIRTTVSDFGPSPAKGAESQVRSKEGAYW